MYGAVERPILALDCVQGRIQDLPKGADYDELGARAYNGGLGQNPQLCSGAKGVSE